MTVRELIRKSFLLGGIIASSESMSDDEANDAFTSLNDMLESWSSEGLLLFNSVRESFDLVSGTQAYLMGTGQAWATTKPMSIEAVSVLQSGSEYTLDMITLDEWQSISNKSDQGLPSKVYIEQNASTYKFYLWPVPDNSNYDAIVYSRKPLTSFTGLSQTVTLPQGYSRAIRYNLAVELMTEFGKMQDQVIYGKAEELKANLKRNNYNGIVMANDTTGLVYNNTFDFYSGES